MKNPAWLLEFQSDAFSQSGEDGVIAKILDIVGDDDKWCVEFGAHDGIHLSNTRNLILNRGYRAILIEGDPERFDKLKSVYRHEPRVLTIKAMVGFGSDNGLDHLLSSTEIAHEFSFLSIDIDGNDYHVWRAITKYSPRVVCVEFNPTIPTEVAFVQEADDSITQGSSLRALFELGKTLGYELVSVLYANAIFVRRKYFGAFEIENNDPALLRKDLSHVTYIFSGFDGTVFLRGCQMLPFHRIEFNEKHVQRLPRLLRKYPTSYGPLRKALYVLYLAWSEPHTFWKKLKAKLGITDRQRKK